MPKSILSLILLGVFSISCFGKSPPPPPAPVAKNLAPIRVNIPIVPTDNIPLQRVLSKIDVPSVSVKITNGDASGSGVIVGQNSNGSYVASCAHLSRAGNLTFEYNGHVYGGNLVDIDKDNDVSIFSMNCKPLAIAPVMGSSYDVYDDGPTGTVCGYPRGGNLFTTDTKVLFLHDIATVQHASGNSPTVGPRLQGSFGNGMSGGGLFINNMLAGIIVGSNEEQNITKCTSIESVIKLLNKNHVSFQFVKGVDSGGEVPDNVKKARIDFLRRLKGSDDDPSIALKVIDGVPYAVDKDGNKIFNNPNNPKVVAGVKIPDPPGFPAEIIWASKEAIDDLRKSGYTGPIPYAKNAKSYWDMTPEEKKELSSRANGK